MNCFVRVAWALGITVGMGGVGGCAVEAGAPEEATAAAQGELAIVSRDVWYVAQGRCGAAGEGVQGAKVNVTAASVCLSPAIAASGVDAATRAAVPGAGSVAGEEVVRVEAGETSPARVRQLFTVIAPPAKPLDVPVDRLRYFQATTSGCDARGVFSFTPVNDAGFLGSRVQRGWGEGDVRVSSAYPLPLGWSDERVRHEVLYEQATFRGMVERPTFDILHPFAERPLLVTVFDLLPAIRSADRCAATP